MAQIARIRTHRVAAVAWALLAALTILWPQPASAQTCLEWETWIMPPRADFGMAYDSARGVTVLFGGRESRWLATSSDSNETWEWNGRGWTLRATTGPSQRAFFPMAFDSKRGVCVLFGGFSDSINDDLGDTWEWDGHDWLLRSTTGPPPRADGLMAFDSGRGVMVLLLLTETWEWDGLLWTFLRAQTGPRHIFTNDTAMTYDEARHVVVAHGGYLQSGGFAKQTWEWDGTSWTLRAQDPKPPFAWLAMAYDAQRKVSVLFGGHGNGSAYGSPQTWEWDGTRWSERASGTPSPRGGTMMAYDVTRKSTVLFGGHAGNFTTFGDTWLWDGQQWKLAHISGPTTREGHAMTFDAGRGETLLAGGTNEAGLFETWTWDGQTWEFRSGYGPKEQFFQLLAYDSARNVAVMFGRSTDPTIGETWEWNGVAWEFRDVLSPPGRVNADMVFDSARNVTVLFGGTTNYPHALPSATWEWDGESWTLRTTDGPSGRIKHCMAYDEARGVTVLFGGVSGSGGSQHWYRETWEWDGSTWILRANNLGPSFPATDEAMIYDTARRVIVLYDDSAAETWEWNGITWTIRPHFGDLKTVERPVMAFDSVRDRIVLFGASSNNYPGGETWEFRPRENPNPDINCDGFVNVTDLLALIGAWGPCPPEPCTPDLDGNAVIGIGDLLMLIGHWSG